jgi:hypothetical protein
LDWQTNLHEIKGNIEIIGSTGITGARTTLANLHEIKGIIGIIGIIGSTGIIEVS